MTIRTTGVHRIDNATAEIAVALRDASPGRRDQAYYDDAMRLRDQVIAGAGEKLAAGMGRLSASARAQAEERRQAGDIVGDFYARGLRDAYGNAAVAAARNMGAMLRSGGDRDAGQAENVPGRGQAGPGGSPDDAGQPARGAG